MGVPRVHTADELGQATADPSLLAAEVWLIDRNTPVMGGPQLCRELRARGCTAVVVGVLVTGDGMSEEVSDFMAAGAALVALKPVTRERLTSSLSSLGLSIQQ